MWNKFHAATSTELNARCRSATLLRAFISQKTRESSYGGTHATQIIIEVQIRFRSFGVAATFFAIMA
ncbi:MAG: hypothetical protein WB581_02180 [Halobacteriota archaeon]